MISRVPFPHCLLVSCSAFSFPESVLSTLAWIQCLSPSEVLRKMPFHMKYLMSFRIMEDLDVTRKAFMLFAAFHLLVASTPVFPSPSCFLMQRNKPSFDSCTAIPGPLEIWYSIPVSFCKNFQLRQPSDCEELA